jgi:dihydrofolate reductase
MSKLRVNAFSISIDGYGAGPGQALEQPMGVGGMALHEWVFGTKTFQKMHGDFAESPKGSQPGRGGVDDDFAARGFENLGAWILGRNMFGPVRGPWTEDEWKGWWGENPPYHVPVFVLTHHARASITMGALTQLVCQRLLEGAVPDGDGRLVLDVDQVSEPTARVELKKAVNKDGTGKAIVRLVVAMREEGDAENWLLTIDVAREKGTTWQQKQVALIKTIFGGGTT